MDANWARSPLYCLGFYQLILVLYIVLIDVIKRTTMMLPTVFSTMMIKSRLKKTGDNSLVRDHGAKE